jgi:hypothetical protein
MKLKIEDYSNEYSFESTEASSFLKTGKSNVIFKRYVNSVIIFPKYL